MKVFLTSTGLTLDSNVDPRFGRCAYFIIYDTSNDTFEYYANEGRDAFGGAGIRTAQMIVEKGAEAVVSGNIGPNSFKVLQSAPNGPLKIYSGVSGTVRNVINQLKNNELKPVSVSDVQSHYGIGRGMGRDY
jgi:predicted Fe-Mo cluster-binding NifX family protein